MKKVFYLIVIATILTTNPLSAMDVENYFSDPQKDFTVTVRQLREWMKPEESEEELKRSQSENYEWRSLQNYTFFLGDKCLRMRISLGYGMNLLPLKYALGCSQKPIKYISLNDRPTFEEISEDNLKLADDQELDFHVRRGGGYILYRVLRAPSLAC